MASQEKDESADQSVAKSNKGTTEAIIEKDPPQPRGASDVDAQYPHGWTLVSILVGLLLGTLLIAIDSTIIGVAIPRISSNFRALQDVGWYGSAYVLTVTAFQPSFGKVYKYFHVKMTYMTCIIIFEVGSVLCASARNSPMFIVGRAIAGLGAAGLLQGALCIISYIAPLEKRPLYIGITISVFGVSTCTGPLLGGVLTDRASWRWCFWINLPVGGFVCVLVLLFLKVRTIQNADRRLPLRTKLLYLDPLGAGTLLAAICCLLLALQWGGSRDAWRSPKIIGLFIGFGLLFIVFCFLQWKFGEMATVPLRVLRQRSILMGSLFLFFNQMVVWTLNYYLPFYFQAVQGVSPITSGVHSLPMAAAEVTATIVISAIVTISGHYVPFMVAGQIIYALAVGLLTRIGLGTPTIQWATYMVLAGIGTGSAQQLPYTGNAIVLSEDDLPVGNAITVFFSQLGGAISVSIAQNLFLTRLIQRVPRYTKEVTAQAVIEAGAANLGKLTSSSEVLGALRLAYADAVRQAFRFALVAACLAIPFTFLVEWKNVKKVSANRDRERERGRDAEDQPTHHGDGNGVDIVDVSHSTDVDLVTTTPVTPTSSSPPPPPPPPVISAAAAATTAIDDNDDIIITEKKSSSRPSSIKIEKNLHSQ